MKVICAGWGRTGTRSLKFALEKLLGQPSYHMQNILLSKKDAKKWHDSIFLNNHEFDWEEIFNGYKIAGKHNYIWDASEFPSGIYFINTRKIGDDNVLVEKICLIK